MGDTTLEEAERLTKKYFDRIPRSEETHDTFAVEPRPDHYVRVEMQTLHFGPALDIRHRIPGVGHPDRPAVELLGEILGDARGPIGAATVGEGLATSLASNTLVTHTNRFSFPATLNVVAHGSNLEALEPAIIGAMENLRTEQIADDVIRAAKKRRRAYWERRRLNWDDVAFDMGHYAIMDSWQTPLSRDGRASRSDGRRVTGDREEISREDEPHPRRRHAGAGAMSGRILLFAVGFSLAGGSAHAHAIRSPTTRPKPSSSATADLFCLPRTITASSSTKASSPSWLETRTPRR